ncbi:MAG: M12 family metallopeptidase [Bacteroidota bacterium]|mgnify:CR=1 FL=1|nr:M12 family metallopeptidase [Bacteroidota bacterium]
MKRALIIAIGLIYVSETANAQSFPRPNCTTIVGDAMLKEMDTTKKRGVSDNYHTWPNGKILLVKFMPGGSKVIRDKVMLCAKEWEKHANLTFKFVPDTTAFTNIRIKLGKGYGHNSAVGTEAGFRPQNNQTMNFDTLFFADGDYYVAKLQKKGFKAPYNLNQLVAEMKADPDHWNFAELKRVVTHEFGHSIGLLHEQSYPGAVNWKKTDSVYNYYQETQGWDKAKVDFNVFEMSNQFYTNGTTYDPKSIMHYAINAWETTNGYSVKQNYDLSVGDKTLIAGLYPKDKKESTLVVPKVDITNFGKLSVVTNSAKKGISIYPVFDLKTNSKLGQVYVVARLADEYGYYIPTSNQYYNWGGTAATYLKMNLLPNSKVSYNKTTKKNLELFFPFAQMPELNGRKVMIVFAVYLDDVANGQMDKLMYFSTTTPLSVTK